MVVYIDTGAVHVKWKVARPVRDQRGKANLNAGQRLHRPIMRSSHETPESVIV